MLNLHFRFRIRPCILHDLANSQSPSFNIGLCDFHMRIRRREIGVEAGRLRRNFVHQLGVELIVRNDAGETKTFAHDKISVTFDNVCQRTLGR